MADTMPTATKWLLTSVGSAEQSAIESVYMVVSKKTNTKGTAFAVNTGPMITNEHVVRGSGPGDLGVIASTGQHLAVTSLKVDVDLDLAALQVNPAPTTGLRIRVDPPSIGE